MRVYFISSGLRGCYNVRCLLPLIENGWDGDITSFVEDSQTTPEEKTQAVMNSDVVVFHRPEHPDKLKMARHLKELGKIIVFDNDDTYKDVHQVKFNKYMHGERVKRGMNALDNSIDTFIKEADVVTTSTQFLADEYKKLNPNVHVLKNCVDPFLFDEPSRNKGEKVRIGITGSVGVTSDIDVMEPIFRHYENDPRVQLVMFTLNGGGGRTKLVEQIYQDEYRILDSFKNIEWVPFVKMSEYYKTLNELRLDIQLIPRKETYFNQCKSNLKFLESSMLEIPVIAQAFSDGTSPYQGVDAPYMLLANTLEEWIEQTEKMIADKKLRRSMGKKARKYVEENYNIADNAHLWEEVYDNYKKQETA